MTAVPRTPAVTDLTVMHNLQALVRGPVFVAFDDIARRRGLNKAALLREIVEHIVHDGRKLDRLIGKFRP